MILIHYSPITQKSKAKFAFLSVLTELPWCCWSLTALSRDHSVSTAPRRVHCACSKVAVALRSTIFDAIPPRQKMPSRYFGAIGDSTACTLAFYIIKGRSVIAKRTQSHGVAGFRKGDLLTWNTFQRVFFSILSDINYKSLTTYVFNDKQQNKTV